MYTKKLLCILLLCIFGVLGSSVYDTTLFVKKYLESELGFDLNAEQKTKHKIWEKGMIPYYIDKFSYDKPLRDVIRNELHETGDLTGLAFTELDVPPESKSTRWVLFINRINKLECDEHTVTGQGAERIVLGYDCLARGVAIPKAVMAILNIPPQHNSPDRDIYIEVVNNNIMEGKKKYFKKIENTDWLYHELAYDFASVTHYPYYQYSSNGAYTITPVKYSRENIIVGEGTTYSEYDVWKIALLYNYIIGRSKLPSDHCSKLFKAGTNYSKIAPDRTDLKHAIKPRKLPNAYFNLPDETMRDINKTSTTTTAGDDSGENEEGDDIQEEGGDIQVEGDNIQVEGDNIQEEGNDIQEEGDNLHDDVKDEDDGNAKKKKKKSTIDETHIFRKNNFRKGLSENKILVDLHPKDVNKTDDDSMFDF